MPTLRDFLDKEPEARLKLEATGIQSQTFERVSGVDKPDDVVWFPAEKKYEKGEWIKHQAKLEAAGER